MQDKKKKDDGEKGEAAPAPELPTPSTDESLPAPPVEVEKTRTPKQYRNQNEFSEKRGPRPEKREGGRGDGGRVEGGRGEGGRGRGRGDKPYAGRGGRGRGDYRKKDGSSETPASAAPAPTEAKVILFSPQH